MGIPSISRSVAIAVILVAMLAVAGCNVFGGGDSLTGTSWQWTASTTTVPASQSVTPDPENYTIEFNTDGTYSAKADCNQVNGSYTTSGSSLSIAPGASTLAFCGDDSQDSFFLAGLAAAQSYAIAGGELTITTTDGTMTFK